MLVEHALEVGGGDLGSEGEGREEELAEGGVGDCVAVLD